MLHFQLQRFEDMTSAKFISQIISCTKMTQIESCELQLTIKELKLAVKFPCKLTFQHAGKSLTSEISSNSTNIFSVNKDVTIKEEKPKDSVEININLATEKGGNIMAGIIRLILKDINSSEGQTLSVPLQKCLDSYATCTLYIKSIRMSKSRVKIINASDDKRSRIFQDNKFQTKSEAPGFQAFKSRARVNEADQFYSKKVINFNNVSSSTSYLKEKALSTAGFKAVKDTSFDRQELGSRFKHLSKKVEEEDSKTVITGRWRETDQVLKSTMEANEKALKMEILKNKTKYEESERNLEEKQKQIKGYKDQISELNRQIAEKQYLLQEISTKNSQISKLEQTNKQLSKELHQDRNRIIDLQRQIQEQKSQFLNQISRNKEQFDKKQYDMQKQIYQKREQLKEMTEENQYKVNQIKKMKILIEDLEKNMEVKALQFQRIYTSEKNEHNKTRANYQAKITEFSSKIQLIEGENEKLRQSVKVGDQKTQKLEIKLKQVEDSLKQAQGNLEQQILKKEKTLQQKRLLSKNEEEVATKLKQVQKQMTVKQKETAETIHQLTETNNFNKKKIAEYVQKSKSYTARIQQLENKCNILIASEQKLKRNLQISQKESRTLQQNEKVALKNLKLKDDRILQLERDLSDSENKTNMKENLGKKELQYKITQIEKLNSKIAEMEKQYQKEKQENEGRRLELLKAENKIKMLEETNHRLTQQISQLKLNFAKKEEELRSSILELNEEVKQLEAKDAQHNKEIHNLEMEKINLKNEMTKAEKMIQNYIQKQQRTKKRQLQLQSSLKALAKELQLKNEEIIQLESDYKSLQNDYKLLQADKSKHQKITTIISEEKDTIKSDVSKLKKQIQKRDQKQEQYLSEIKSLKEQVTKNELKLSTVVKEGQKFKNIISQSVKSVLLLKQSYPSMDNLSQSNLQYSRIQRSRVIRNQNSDLAVTIEQNKLADIIENFSRQTHTTISLLNQEIRKLKKERDHLEKQNNGLNSKLKDTQQQLSKTIRDMSNEVESIISRTNDDAEQYEQRLSYLQKQLAKKEKALNEMTASMQELTNINENQRSTNEITVSDLLSKIESLKFKIIDLERKDQGNAQVFVSLQEKIAQLQQYTIQLTGQNEMLKDQIQKKQRTIIMKTQENEDLMDELQSMKKIKNEQSIQLISLKESIVVERENNQRLVNQIKSQESKNSQLKLFQNDILKEKETFLKKDFEKSQKLYSLEEKLQYSLVELAERNEQLTQKTRIVNQQKDTIKQLQSQISINQTLLNQAKISLEKERERLKEKERKNGEKDAEIQNLNALIKKNAQRHEAQIKKLSDEIQAYSQRLNKEKLESSVRAQEYELQIKGLKDAEKRLNELNISLEEQIYFQKQNNALSASKIQELKQHIYQMEIEENRLNNEIGVLSEEVKEKEESLFALSGKLYASDNRLQAKDEDFRQRLQKVELDWRYKIQEICEEYQHKLQIIQREKNYVRTGMNDFNETVEKLENEKIALKVQHEREKEAWQQKSKRFQEEKLAALIDKNKQIEKLREVIEDQEQKIKRKDHELKLSEDQRKKIDEKLKEIKAEAQRAEERRSEGVRVLEKEIDQLKRKEGQLKRFKEALKNSQWTTQREIKKSIQNATKSMANISNESAKGELLEIMKGLQSTVIKLALPNIDEL